MISVVIPLYNKQDSVAVTLQSVLNQTCDNFEIVIVDDGSTDNSLQIVKDIAATDKRINVISKENRGVSSARNIGIENSSFEYIAFLDADDLWDPNYLEEQVKLINDFPLAAMWGTAWGHIVDGLKKKNDFRVDEGFRDFVTNYWQKNMYLFFTSAIIVSKKSFDFVGGFDERISYGEDLDMWYRIILNFPVVFYNRTLAFYRLDAENRAMDKPIPLNKYLPFYIDKYSDYRKNNREFRLYFDRECLGRLYLIVISGKDKIEVERILNNINLNEFKYSIRFRFKYPKLYEKYLNFKNK